MKFLTEIHSINSDVVKLIYRLILCYNFIIEHNNQIDQDHEITCEFKITNQQENTTYNYHWRKFINT